MGAPVVGILVCDHVAPELRGAAGGDYGDLYAAFLRAVEPSLEVRTYDAVGSEQPASPTECDAWVITGSRHDAFADDAWLVALRALVVRLRTARARTVGICFGHQVLAQSLGGEVVRAEAWKAGPQALDVDTTPWFRGGAVHLNAMHRDVVATLPVDGVVIGSGTTAAVPAFLVGDSMLGIQDHPEFEEAYTAALIDARRERMGAETADRALEAVAATPTDGPEVARWIVDFLLDRRRAGP